MSYIASHRTGAVTSSIRAHAATHGYTVAFAVAAGVFLIAAPLCGSLIRKHALQTTPVEGEPVAEPSPAVSAH
jgi:hypothetical protein